MKVKTNKRNTSYDFNLIRNMITSEINHEQLMVYPNNQLKVSLLNDVMTKKNRKK